MSPILLWHIQSTNNFPLRDYFMALFDCWYMSQNNPSGIWLAKYLDTNTFKQDLLDVYLHLILCMFYAIHILWHMKQSHIVYIKVTTLSSI